MSRKPPHTEFGRGYATCLIQFAFHRPRLDDDVALWADMHTEHPDLFTPRDAAETWANGSSDHLYDLLRPRHGLPASDWQAARAIRDRALDIGHGFRPSSQSDPDECYRLLDEADRLLRAIGVATFDEAFAWDEAHGLRPSKGYSATCVELMEHRRVTG